MKYPTLVRRGKWNILTNKLAKLNNCPGLKNVNVNNDVYEGSLCIKIVLNEIINY